MNNWEEEGEPGFPSIFQTEMKMPKDIVPNVFPLAILVRPAGIEKSGGRRIG
ncbi:hypothetical protein [Paraburkholderia dilworthii]|uniref:Uncharacterized protein n=1 Tax=Paraburkholderia dilworthii TaxID=948106 RepID=A0ABW9DDV8_9BURK